MNDSRLTTILSRYNGWIEEKREYERERKRERCPAHLHPCTVCHHSFLPFFNSSFRSPMHMPNIPVSFRNILMCSAVHREASIHSVHLSLLECFSQLIYHNKSHVLFKTSDITRLNNEIIILTILINIIITNNNFKSDEIKYFNLNWYIKETQSRF